MLQAAWFALLWASEGADPRGRRAGAMALSLAVAAAGAASFVVVNLTDGSSIWLLPNVAAAVGFGLAG